MAWTNKPHTMAIAYAHICAGEDPWVALGNFTNDFFHRKNRVRLLQDPVVQLPEIPITPVADGKEATHQTSELHRWAVFCAASVEYLCKKYDLAAPSWVVDPQFGPLPEPWYHLPEASLQKQQVRTLLVENTPEAFKTRNIFCGERIYLDKRAEAEKLRKLLSA